MKNIQLALVILIGVAGLAVSPLSAQSADPENKSSVTGWAELLYRSVDVDGSQAKYDEDFDGLSDGVRLSNLDLAYDRGDANKIIDFARLGVRGLGGEPWESIDFKMGNTSFYELSVNWTKQNYVYNLFGLVPDQDAHVYDTERQITDILLKIYATKKIEVRAGFRENRRTGSTLFLKNVEGDDFAFPTPMDLNYRYYTVGATFEVGPVDLVFEQTHRDHTINFNSTAGILGQGQVGLGGVAINQYDWDQRQTGTEDVTTVVVSSEVGKRVDVTAAVFGTLFSSQRLEDTVQLDSDSVTNGTNRTELETDWLVADVQLSVLMHRIASFHFQYRNYTYDVKGDVAADLAGSGTPSTDRTKFDWTRDVISGLFEIRPLRSLTLQVGVRQASRTLKRDGFTGRPGRNTDFDSDPDRSLMGGLTWRATRWFTLNGSYEDVQVDQPFTAPSISDAQQAKLRLTFTPKKGMRAVVGFMDRQNENSSANFRSPDDLGDSGCDPSNPAQVPGTCRWNSTAEITRWDVSWTHQPIPGLDYLLRYAEEGIKTSTGIVVDGAITPGLDIYDVDQIHALGQVNYSWSRWSVHARLWISDSDGVNPLITSGFTETPTSQIMQDYRDGDIGVRYTFLSKIFVGASIRAFDYDDANDLLDYDGRILTLTGGMAF